MNSYENAYRYAIYFCPAPDSAWWQAGSSWLGRCAWTSDTHAQPKIAGLSEAEFATRTSDPRRYGWHATLKAPFSLNADVRLGDLREAVAVLAKRLTGIQNLKLHPARLGHFIALIPSLAEQASQINHIAREVVEHVHPLVRPLTEDEIARRRKSKLTPEQDALMLRWGYPYVMDHFKFHLSLTDRLDQLPESIVSSILTAADTHFGSLPDLHLDGLAIFAEPVKGADFRLVEIHNLK